MSTLATPDLGASANAVRRHYDVGNEFYGLWLDPSYTYSCALWEDGDSLETAQRRKLDYHVEQARARGVARVLDVGCGWGSLLRHLVDAKGVGHATGLTLSQQQAAVVAGFEDPRIEVRLESWRDHEPSAPYDAIVSIGAFEHFARLDLSAAEKLEAYHAFFRCCHRWLVPGGHLSLQTITYESSNRAEFSEFFAEEIFPESEPPHLWEIVKAADRLFEVVAARGDREHYVRTLRAWRAQLRAHRPAAEAAVGADTVARYDKYLQMAMVGFHRGTMGLARVTLRRLDPTRTATR